MTTQIDTAALRRLYALVAYAGAFNGDRALREFMLSVPALLDAADERDQLRAEVAKLRGLLVRVEKYVREDRAVTPGVTRLARLGDEIRSVLEATKETP